MQDKECIELQNIRYKTMLLPGKKDIAPSTVISSKLTSVENILDKERDREQKEPWNRLDKTTKVRRLICYADEIAVKEKLSKTERTQMKSQLISYLDKKLLQRNKDVIYDNETGIISDIQALEWASAPKRFTLRRNNKSSIQKPPKTRKKIDNIIKD